MHEAIGERKRGVSAILVGNRVDFFANKFVPVLVLAEVDEYPGSVDAGVELTSEKGADNKLWSCISNVDQKVTRHVSYRDDLSNIITLIDQELQSIFLSCTSLRTRVYDVFEDHVQLCASV